MTEIDRWVRTGADVQEGLRLLSVYRPNPPLARLVGRAPGRYRDLLIRTLTGIDRQTVAEAASGDSSLRSDWPFLADPSCPPELKILAADKITAWKEFVSWHSRLYSATSPEECLEAAKNSVKYYCQNRKIYSEFAYYQEHKTILGKHPVFDEMRRLRNLRSSGILSLVKKEKNLQGCVWRLRRDLASGSRHDLDESRETILESRMRELQEVRRMIEEYNNGH